MPISASVKKIFSKDKNSIYLWCNESYARDFNITPKQIIGKTDFDLYPKKLAQKYISDDKKIIKGGQTIDIEEEYLVNSKTISVHTIKTPTRDKNGTINGLLGVFWDTTLEKETEKKLSAITSAAKDAIVMMDPSNNISFWNQAAEKMFGYSQSQVLGKNLHHLITTKKEHQKTANLKKFSQTGQSAVLGQTIELPVKNKSGHIFFVELTISGVSLNNQWYAVGIMRDITDRKLTEKKLNESQKKYQTYVEQAPYGVFIANLKGQYTEVNQTACRLFGYKKEEMLKLSIPQIVSPESASAAQKSFFNLLKTGKDESELEFKKKNGDLFLGVVSAVSLSDDSVIGFVSDISDRKKREQEISRLASIVENSQDAIISKTLDGTITSWNHGAEKIYGYTEKEMLGKNISLIVPKHKQVELDQILKKIGHGQPVGTHRTERVDKSGRIVYVSLSASPVVDQSQKIIGASAISRDVSRQIEEEQRLEKINRLMVGRELKMVELKQELARLKHET